MEYPFDEQEQLIHLIKRLLLERNKIMAVIYKNGIGSEYLDNELKEIDELIDQKFKKFKKRDL